MSEDNDRQVARTLGKIEESLIQNGKDVSRLSMRLLGDDDDGGDGGIIGAHNRRIQKLEIWYIRVTAAVVVWTFMTGSGPVNLGNILQLFHKP